MLRRLFSKKPIPVPELYVEVEQEFGEPFTAKWIMQNRENALWGLMLQKRFQNRVLFPHFGIPTPTTMVARDSGHEFYPLFFKSGRHYTFYVDSAEELLHHMKQEPYKDNIVQAYIKPTTSVASHIRLVLAIHRSPEKSIRGAAVLYATEQGERRSNHRHGGAGIPLTGQGSLEDITDFEKGLLEDLNIDPDNRRIPEEILRYVFESRDADGEVLFNWFKLPGFDIGIDTVLGCPFSYNGHDQTEDEKTPKWYFLETEPDPSTRLLEKIGAVLPWETIYPN